MKNIAGKQKQFWEEMAARYPSSFDKKTLADTNQVIAFVEARGVKLAGANILDIGCGTGIYTLPLALRAAQVVGLDYSETMLARCEQDRVAHNVANVSLMRASWPDIDPAGFGLEKSFDVVWCAMTPAVRGAGDLSKMSRCSRRWCVYVGWGSIRSNPFLEEVFKAHGRTFGPPPGVTAVAKILASQGIKVEIDYFQTQWDWEGSEREAMTNAQGFLEGLGSAVVARPEIVEKIVLTYSVNGHVHHRTQVEMGVLVWQVV